MSTFVTYDGNQLRFVDSVDVLVIDQLDAEGRGARYQRLTEIGSFGTGEVIFLDGAAGLQYRSERYKRLKFLDSTSAASSREEDGLVWPTGVQRFGNS